MWKSIVILFCCVFSTTLGAQTKVLAFAGSARVASVNKKLVAEAAEMAREMGADVVLIDLKDYPIPLYNGDLEAACGMPENAKKIRRLMIDSQVIMIASPDYNSSVTGLLKNTLDWASRGEHGGASYEAYKGKKFAIMSASPGAQGGRRGLVQLKQILESIGGQVISPQVSIPRAYTAFDEQGHLKDKQLRADLQTLVRNALCNKL